VDWSAGIALRCIVGLAEAMGAWQGGGKGKWKIHLLCGGGISLCGVRRQL
jgi:hypothetical protein